LAGLGVSDRKQKRKKEQNLHERGKQPISEPEPEQK
jgi:hypothetical protein